MVLGYHFTSSVGRHPRLFSLMIRQNCRPSDKIRIPKCIGQMVSFLRSQQSNLRRVNPKVVKDALSSISYHFYCSNSCRIWSIRLIKNEFWQILGFELWIKELWKGTLFREDPKMLILNALLVLLEAFTLPILGRRTTQSQFDYRICSSFSIVLERD